MNGIVAATEPADVVEEQAPQSTEAAEEVTPAVAATLEDDTLVELEDADGKKVQLPWKDVKGGYRLREASDRKFTDADKKEKEAQRVARELNKALTTGKQDPLSLVNWVAKETGKESVDVLTEMLDKATDPKLIDKLAALLERKLQAEETEQKRTPEDKRAEAAEKRAQEAEAKLSQLEDQRVEKELFDTVGSTLEEVGLQKTALNAVQVIELVLAGAEQDPPIKLTYKDAAGLLRENFRSGAEMLFKPEAGLKAATLDAQSKANGANGASSGAVLAVAKAEAKKEQPRVTVVKNKKKDEEESEGPGSFLSALSRVYAGKF